MYLPERAVARTVVAIGVALLSATISAAAHAQFMTVGGGVLLSARSPQPVVELHAETPPFARTRGYLTVSWTDESATPALITAGERLVVSSRHLMIGAGAGLLWLEFNDYRPYPVLLSSAVVPLPIPRTSIVTIASTQPFQDFEWSLVLKLGVTVWFLR